MSTERRQDLVSRLHQDIQKWEGQELEFMQDFPEQASDLAKEIAAFATSNTGTIYIGVDEDRTIVGISGTRDSIQNRLAGICQKAIKPAIIPTFELIEIDKKLVAKIDVPKGSEPVYYCSNTPYIRNLTLSEPATPDQVRELHKKYLIAEIVAMDRLGPSGPTFHL